MDFGWLFAKRAFRLFVVQVNNSMGTFKIRSREESAVDWYKQRNGFNIHGERLHSARETDVAMVSAFST